MTSENGQLVVAYMNSAFNARQSPGRYAILEAAALVHDKGTPDRIVQELDDEAIDRYAELASVKKVLEARREQAATDEGKLSHCRSRDALPEGTPAVLPNDGGGTDERVNRVAT